MRKSLRVSLLIENHDGRLNYTPWIAALWIELKSRRQGVAAKLIKAARGEAACHGYVLCYLCATPDNSPYYLARDFEKIESR